MERYLLINSGDERETSEMMLRFLARAADCGGGGWYRLLYSEMEALEEE